MEQKENERRNQAPRIEKERKDKKNRSQEKNSVNLDKEKSGKIRN